MSTVSVREEINGYVREVIVNYRGPRRKSPKFTEPMMVATFLRECLIDNSREQFIAVYLNHTNQVIGYSIAAIGTQSQCPVSPAELFQKAVLLGAGSLIVAHNHPSGNTEPSKEDIAVTKRIWEAGKLLGITLLDHIIVCEDKYLSFREENLLES